MSALGPAGLRLILIGWRDVHGYQRREKAIVGQRMYQAVISSQFVRAGLIVDR